MELLNFLLLAVGFVLLVKGADFLVEGAAASARKFNVSEIIIGLTLVSFGTSFPELVVNVLAAVSGENEVVLGNVIGSNIFNTLAILGVAGVITPLVVHDRTIKYEIPFSILITILVLALGNEMFTGGSRYINVVDGVILLALFVAFMMYIYFQMRVDRRILAEVEEVIKVESMANWKMILYIIGGMVGLVIGGKLVVDNAVDLAQEWGVSKKLISITIISAGTSLPELATSAVAAMKKKADLAVGNVIGSNIFNILLVLGTSTAIHPLTYDKSFDFDIVFFIGASVLLFLLIFIGKIKRLARWEAIVLLASFFFYMGYLLVREGVFNI